MPNAQQWKSCFPSEPVMVRQAVRDMLQFVDNCNPAPSPDERWVLKLIFNELLFNAVVHGNASDAAKRVYVYVRAERHFVRACITDEGSGYNYRSIIEQSKRQDNLQSESGRGIKLVLALADHVRFSRGGRRVTITKRIGRPIHE